MASRWRNFLIHQARPCARMKPSSRIYARYFITRLRKTISLKTRQHGLHMFHLRRGGEEFADQAAPCGEGVAVAEVHGMVFQGGPAHYQAVTFAVFDRTLQAHGLAAARVL